MKKKIIVIENEKQEKILKEALRDFRWMRNMGIKNSGQNQKNEEKIDEIYEAEKLEKQLEK